MGTPATGLSSQAKSFFTFGHLVGVVGLGALGYAALFSATGPRVGIFVGAVCAGISYLLKKS